MTEPSNADSRYNQALEEEWALYATGTYSIIDKRIFDAAFYRGWYRQARLQRQRWAEQNELGKKQGERL